MIIAMGITKSCRCELTTLIPSTALRTEIAGVTMLSPMNKAAPNMPVSMIASVFAAGESARRGADAPAAVVLPGVSARAVSETQQKKLRSVRVVYKSIGVYV